MSKKIETYVVNSPTGLNVRDDVGGEIIGVLKNKARVTYKGGFKEHNGITWILVQYRNLEGYVMEKYLKKV